MSCLIRIRRRYPDPAQSDKKFADYLLTRPDAAHHLSSQQLAFEADINQSSAVKLVQRMGFEGSPTLKLTISETLASNPNPHFIPVHSQICGDDPVRMVGEKLIKESMAATHATLNANSKEELVESVTTLHSVHRIIVTGTGAQGLVAQSFAWKLLKIGFNAVVEHDMHALLAAMQTLSPNGLLLAVSYTGERRELNLAADETLYTDAKAPAITGFILNVLQQWADHCLHTIAEEQATHNVAVSSTRTQMMLTDLLFMALMQQDLEHTPGRIRHSRALVERLV